MLLYGIFASLLLASLWVILAPAFKYGDAPKRQRVYFAIITAAFFFIAGFGLYFLWGSPDIIPLLAQRQEKIAQLREIINRRSAEVKANPQKLDAWVELGQSFMETGQFPAAANAFRQAVVLSQGNPLLITAYAEALIFAAGGKVTDDAEKSLQMALLQQPDNPQARYYLAVRELQDGRTQDAMKDMKALYHSLPEDSPVRAMIDKEIGK